MFRYRTWNTITEKNYIDVLKPYRSLFILFLLKCFKQLHVFKELYERNVQNINVVKSVAKFDQAQRNEQNPLKQGLPLKSKNIFIDIIDFALKENIELIYTIIKHSGCNGSFDSTMVIHTAKIYMQMASKLNFHNNTFQ